MRIVMMMAVLSFAAFPLLILAQVPPDELTAENASLMDQVGWIGQPSRWQMLGLAWSPDGIHLAMSTDTGIDIREFSGNSMRPGRHYGNTFLSCVTYSPSGKLLAACNSYDGTVFVWNEATGELAASVNTGRYKADEVEFSPDGTLMAVRNGFSNGEEVTLWGVWSNGKRQPLTAYNAYQVQKLATFGGRAIDMSFNFDGSLLAIIDGTRNELRVWDTVSEEMVSSQPLTRVYAADFSPDGRYLAISVHESDVVILDAVSFEEVRTFSNDGSSWRITDLDFSPNSALIAISTNDGTVQVWDVEAGKLLSTLTGHPDIAWRLAFNPAGTVLASLGWNDGIRLWGRGDALTMLARPTATAAATKTPMPVPVLGVGGTAHVQTTDGDVLNMRDSASRRGTLIAKLDNGALVTILEGPQEDEGLLWWNVRTEDGLEGWVVEGVDGEQTLIAN